MKSLEGKLGYRFQNGNLLHQALTHRSMSGHANNQRLEFLGDRVIGLVVARLLYSLYPKEAEGDLAKRHSALVSGHSLAQLALELSLDQGLIMTASEASSGGRENPSNLEDVFEALVGAMYLDGGLEPTEKFLQKHFRPLAQQVKEPPKDAKTSLQEWAQARGLPLPEYTILSAEGPDHAPVFTIEVSLMEHGAARATGASKRTAEQAAAAELLEQLK